MFHPTLRCTLSSLVIVCASAPWIQAAPADTILDQGLHQIMQVAEENKGATPAVLSKKARPVLDKLFNFESLTKRAIGPGWKELSPEQQKESVTLFSEILIRSYAARFDWNNKLEVQFAPPVDTGGGRCEVSGIARYAGNVVHVLYRMESSGATWRVYDVVVEGISMASNYRTQFDSIRQHGGGEALIKSMHDNLKQ